MDWGALRGNGVTIAYGDYNGAGETLARALGDLRERVERRGGGLVADAPVIISAPGALSVQSTIAEVISKTRGA